VGRHGGSDGPETGDCETETVKCDETKRGVDVRLQRSSRAGGAREEVAPTSEAETRNRKGLSTCENDKILGVNARRAGMRHEVQRGGRVGQAWHGRLERGKR